MVGRRNNHDLPQHRPDDGCCSEQCRRGSSVGRFSGRADAQRCPGTGKPGSKRSFPRWTRLATILRQRDKASTVRNTRPAIQRRMTRERLTPIGRPLMYPTGASPIHRHNHNTTIDSNSTEAISLCPQTGFPVGQFHRRLCFSISGKSERIVMLKHNLHDSFNRLPIQGRPNHNPENKS